jgi:hypothetical protein
LSSDNPTSNSAIPPPRPRSPSPSRTDSLKVNYIPPSVTTTRSGCRSCPVNRALVDKATSVITVAPLTDIMI